MRGVRRLRVGPCMHKGDLVLGRTWNVSVLRVPVSSNGALVTETLLLVRRERGSCRDGGVFMLVLGFPARCQVVLERVHVRRQLRDLPENDSQVHVQTCRQQMKTSCSNGSEPCSHQNLVGLLIRRKHCAPTSDCSSVHVGVTSS